MKQTHKQIEHYLFAKNYKKVEEKLYSTPKDEKITLQNLFCETVEVKLDVYQSIMKSYHHQPVEKQTLQHYRMAPQRLQKKYNSLQSQLKKIYILGLSFFILEMIPKKENLILDSFLNDKDQSSMLQNNEANSQEKILIRKMNKQLGSVGSFCQNQAIRRDLLRSTYCCVCFIQLQTKKLIQNKRQENKQEIYELLRILGDLMQKDEETKLFGKKIQLILIHLRIYFLNSALEVSCELAVQEMLNLIIEQYDNQKPLVFSYETIITLLYNVVKILLGSDQIPPRTLQLLSIVLRKNNMPTPNNYNETIFRLFLIIKMIIFRQTTKLSASELEKEDDHQPDAEDQLLQERFSTFMNLNLDTTVVQLKEVARNVVRHRVASLATVIGFKLGIENLALDFLELMHDSPYNNDIQTIKLCFELFESRQFSKLQHLFQIVLSASSCKNLKERQVLIAMCNIFIGIYLENREQGLLYAKLNHFQNKKRVLREQTLLQHLGFSYYNLAKSQIYLEHRNCYLAKALQNFQKSYQLNPCNYVVTYCISKIYLKIYDYENAFKYALESCKCNRGRWVPFGLLACVYMVQKKIHKAIIIIDQLLKKYPEENILYYIRAYIETNKILLDIQYDEEVQAAKELDEEIYQLTKERILKNKTFHNLIYYCQQFYLRSISAENRQFDENFFNIPTNFIHDFNDTTNTQFHDSSSTADKSTLLMITNLFIQLDQLQTAEGILKTISQMNHTATSKSYKAIIYLKRKEYDAAFQQFKKILEKENMHVESLIQCAMLEKNQAEALNYITLAEKFTNGSKFWLAKGMVLSRLEKFEQAHQCFIRDGESAWLEQLPQKLYYY